MGTFVDIAFVAVLLFFVISGFRRGFVRSLAELLGCIVSIALAVMFSSQLAASAAPLLKKWAPSWHGSALMDRVIAAVILFVVLEALVQMVALAADRLFHLPVLRQINALLGGILGLLKGGAVLLMIFSVMQLFLPAEKLWKTDPLLQKINGTSAIQYVYTHNPVYNLLEKDLWNGVGIYDKQKQEL